MERSGNSGKDIFDSENSQGDFDFFDLLRILWKRRYIILFGTAAIVVIIAILSFLMPKVYRSQTVLKPGLSHIDTKRKWVQLDSPEEIKFYIESELQYKLEKQISESQGTEFSLPLNFKILADKSRNTVTVLCDSPTPSDGIIKLRLLLDALKESYQQKLRPFLVKYESDILLAQKELVHISKEQEFIDTNLNNMQISLEKFIKENIRGSSDLKSPNNLGRYLANYSAVVETISRLKQTQSKNDLKNVALKNEIKQLENEKKKLRAISVIQTPATISAPSRPNINLNLIASPIIGFFLALFLVFFVEYVRNLIKKIKQKKILY